MSKALGGTVTKNPLKEIGWGQVTVTGLAAQDWLARRPALHTLDRRA